MYNRQKWTANDIRVLRKTYRNNRTTVVAKKLGRTLGSVSTKASRLGIQKTKKHMQTIHKANTGIRRRQKGYIYPSSW